MRLPNTRKPQRLPETPEEALACIIGGLVHVLIARGVLPPEATHEISDAALAAVAPVDDGTVTGRAARAAAVTGLQDLLRPWLEWSNLPWAVEDNPEPPA
jgi:acyl-coenzyme A synthetase/AMP-(fatty) acid ligase